VQFIIILLDDADTRECSVLVADCPPAPVVHLALDEPFVEPGVLGAEAIEDGVVDIEVIRTSRLHERRWFGSLAEQRGQERERVFHGEDTFGYPKPGGFLADAPVVRHQVGSHIGHDC
jgi:hypothetical protein